MPSGKKRVLIVDDSVFARKIVTDILQSSAELEVVGAANNGRDALDMIPRLKPDAVTLDIEMPGLNGLDTLKCIMQDCPTPVLMLSSLTTKGAKESISALSIGAVDVMAKPHGTHAIGMASQAKELILKVMTVANVTLDSVQPLSRPAAPVRRALQPTVRSSSFPVVIIASSTGGPRALRTLVPGLTNEGGVAYVIVQHLPEGFSGPLAKDLDAFTDLNVREAADGDSLRPGDVIFAKAGYHCVFEDAATIRLTRTPPLWGVRPSADVTIASAVPIYRNRLVGVVLTGMGHDGTDGVRLIKEAGGMVLAEHESSCVVYGMPRSAVETGAVDVVTPLDKMAMAVNAVVADKVGHPRRRDAAA